MKGSFEYTRITVKNDLAVVACDCYESLGYELVGQKANQASGATILSFRRERGMANKASLMKIQRSMDDLLEAITTLEASKTKTARMTALATGIVSALVMGIGMSCTMVWGDMLMIPGIIIGLLGIAGCIGTWFLYRKNVLKSIAIAEPQIEDAYDGLAILCEEAQVLLRQE